MAERDAPYGVAVCAPSPDMLALGDARVAAYISRFGHCLHSKVWPSYPPYVAHIEPKPWDIAAMGERVLREEHEQNGRAA